MISRFLLCALLGLAMSRPAPAPAQMPPGGPPAAGIAPGDPPQPEAAPGQPLDQNLAQPQEPDVESVEDAPKGRDPFWPVGYTPKPKVKRSSSSSAPTAAVPEIAPEQAPPDWEQARKGITIRGISRIGREKGGDRDKYLAVVNGHVVEEGDAVSVQYGGRVYRWKVQSVGPKGVNLAKLDVR
jgi:hypothetical protein